jgi:hypothetical protein
MHYKNSPVEERYHVLNYNIQNSPKRALPHPHILKKERLFEKLFIVKISNYMIEAKVSILKCVHIYNNTLMMCTPQQRII